jgi:hypothetical protein
MNAFLVTSSNGVSEWLPTFDLVEEHQAMLEKIGVVSNVKIQMFKNSILAKEFTYNYNGQEWEK